MRAKRAAVFALVLLVLAPAAALAEDGGFEAGLLAGAAFPSYDSLQRGAFVDEYGTRAGNVFTSRAETGLSFGAGVRYVGAGGLGVELLYERARLDLDAVTRFDLAWESIAGPRSESRDLEGTGRLDVQPLSLNAVYRARLAERVALSFSGGLTLERIELRERAKAGVAVVIGDALEAIAVDTLAEESTWRTAWNMGFAVDFQVAGGLWAFVDGRYYGDAAGTVRGRRVEPGSYAGLHLGGTVAVDPAAAASYDARIHGGAFAADIDTRMMRAAAGLRYRF